MIFCNPVLNGLCNLAFNASTLSLRVFLSLELSSLLLRMSLAMVSANHGGQLGKVLHRVRFQDCGIFELNVVAALARFLGAKQGRCIAS